MRGALPGAIALLLVASPAAFASTIPPLDLAAGQNATALGFMPLGSGSIVTFAFDRAVAPGVTVGATLFRELPPAYAPKTLFAARVAWMQADFGGLMLSAGGGTSVWGQDVVEGFIQGAGVLRAGLGPVTLRLTAGPALVLMARTAPRTGGITWWDPTPRESFANLSIIPLVINAELALRVWAGHEITAGGYSAVGYRARF